jgi:hypothetical protein
MLRTDVLVSRTLPGGVAVRTMMRIIPCLAFLLSGCSDQVPKANQYVVIVDGSISPGDQSQLWIPAVEARVCKNLAAGDTVAVYEVGAYTAERAPAYEGVIPQLEGMRGELIVRQAVKDACRKITDAVRTVLTGAAARQTRLLDSIPRITCDPGRSVSVLYLTDAVEASPELNLEQVLLDDQTLDSLPQQIVAARGWPKEMLAGALVDFVLDSPPPGSRPRLNSRAHLERFWRSVFQAVGADLRSFDARIGIPVAQSRRPL